MALFVDLDDEAEPPNAQHVHQHGGKLEWDGDAVKQLPATNGKVATTGANEGISGSSNSNVQQQQQQQQPPVDGTSKPAAPRENPNRNGMTEALGAYP